MVAAETVAFSDTFHAVNIYLSTFGSQLTELNTG